MSLWIGLIALLGGCGTCGGEDVCRAGGGQFYAFPPPDWDGVSPLPAVLHFHGYGGSARQYYSDDAVMQGFWDAGLMVVLPEGEAGGWSVYNPEQPDPMQRDELAFVDAVIDELETDWPLDPARLYASGFSAGASVAHVLACWRGERFAAAAPLSGTFWEPIPASCEGPEIPVRHVHGTADETWPPEDGRGFGVIVQGSVSESLAMWRAHDQCSEAVTELIDGPLTCQVWSDCAGGAEVRYCQHDQGHTRLDGWSERSAAWLQGFQR